MTRFDLGKIIVNHFHHDSLSLEFKGKIYHFDPWEKTDPRKADFVFISHDHYDHFSPEDIKKVLKEETKLFVPENLRDKAEQISKNTTTVKPGREFSLNGVGVRVLHAYNIDKFKSPGQVFHPKNFGVAYLLDFNGFTVYFPGDTDPIREIKEIHPDLAMLPVSGVYVMTLDEALALLENMKPKYFLPIHFFNVSKEEVRKKFDEKFGTSIKLLI